MKKYNYSFFDFLGDIVDIVINNNGKHDDPYNVNFTNHYKTLYDVEQKLKETCDNKDIKFNEIVQNKRDKSLTVSVSDVKVGKDIKDSLTNMFEDKNIEFNIQNGKLNSFTISKNSKGVLEEREWQK